MAFCTKCGAALDEGTKFCTACGAPVEDAAPTGAAAPSSTETSAEPAATVSFGFFTNGESSFKKLWSTKNLGDAVKGIVDTTDTSADYDEADKNGGKVMALLSYIWILFLIPFFAARNSKFAMYHVKQGFTLFVISTAYALVSTGLTFVFNLIPVVGVFLTTVMWVISLLFVAGMILGIYNAVTGKAKELPFIGHITFIK